MRLYRLPVDLRRHRNVSECTQGEIVLLIYDYVTEFEKKKNGLALLKERKTALTTQTKTEERRK